VEKGWGWPVDRRGASTADRWAVCGLLKVLGTTTRRYRHVVPRGGEKPGGYPVDSRWTAVDNSGRQTACGSKRRSPPRFSTLKTPVDNSLTWADVGSPQFAQDRR